jgi:hypothetical protein
MIKCWNYQVIIQQLLRRSFTDFSVIIETKNQANFSPIIPFSFISSSTHYFAATPVNDFHAGFYLIAAPACQLLPATTGLFPSEFRSTFRKIQPNIEDQILSTREPCAIRLWWGSCPLLSLQQRVLRHRHLWNEPLQRLVSFLVIFGKRKNTKRSILSQTIDRKLAPLNFFITNYEWAWL